MGNNCTNCIFFRSWKSIYDGDELEPADSGKCTHPNNFKLEDDDNIVIDVEFICKFHERI